MNIAQAIDHTLLKPEATERQIRTLCSEALEYQFAATCVNLCWVPLVSDLLRASQVKTCSVIGFPLGATNTKAKVYEAQQAIDQGAQEIDMVINIGWLKSNELSKVAGDIKAVRSATSSPLVLKVIIEAAVLTDDEIQTMAKMCVDQGADFVKTSTGMHPAGGAKLEHVSLIKKMVGNRAEIKAAGGIRTHVELMKFIQAGATRIGCSSSVQIMQEASCPKIA